MKYHLIKITLNLLAVVLLGSLIAVPIYFAKNFSKVAGVKSESRYLIVSQVEKFPGMKFEQEGDRYQISFTKQSQSQAFLGILILNNPTNLTQTYALEATSTDSKPFFGEDLNNQLTQIPLPATASIPISLLSLQESQEGSQSAEFTINTQ